MYEEMIESSLIFIEENIMEDVTLKNISDYFNISSSHFSRIFAFMIGEPYRQYFLKRKLSHSLSMLDSNESVINTAFAYGFAYPESYTRAFKKVFGLSPKKYQISPEVVKPYGIGKVITRDVVNFNGEILIRCEYEYCDDFMMFGEQILVDKTNPKWIKDAYDAGDSFLENSKDLEYIDQKYYYNEVNCIEHNKLYYLKFLKPIAKDTTRKVENIMYIKGGWFARFHYKGRLADIYDCLDTDIMKWIEKKDEKLEFVGNGILLRYDLKNLSEFDIMVRLKRNMLEQ